MIRADLKKIWKKKIGVEGRSLAAQFKIEQYLWLINDANKQSSSMCAQAMRHCSLYLICG